MFIDREASDDLGQRPEENFVQSSLDDNPVKMTLIGSRRAIERMIGLLHRQNIISGSEWSRPIPIKHSPEFISVASRMIQID